MDMTPRVTLGLELRLSSIQLLVSELLPLPVADLTARVDAELAANPALELAERPSCPGCGCVRWGARCARCLPGHGPIPEAAAARAPRADVLADITPALPVADRRIAAYLVSDVDEYGVLDGSLDPVARRLGVGVDRVRRVIAAIRRAGYPGLCAASLAQRLRLEVAAAGGGGGVPREVHELLARAGGGTVDVEAARRWLRGRVGPDVFHQDRAAALPPAVDLVVRRGGRGLHAEVVAGPWSALRVAASYAVHAGDAGVHREVAGARRFVAAVGRRERLIQRVGAAVVDRHAGRFTGGSAALPALTRRAVAADLGVHESTVSRAVAGKHVALPTRQIVPLATLFGAGDEVHRALRELVGDEAAALSDTALARALAERGHVVARRTVAKYRAALGIPDRARRRPARSPSE